MIKYIAGASLLVSLGLGWVVSERGDTIEALKDVVKEEKAEVTRLTELLEDSKLKLDREKRVTSNLNTKLKRQDWLLSDTLEKLNKYKGREQVVYKKPGLVERLEHKAMDKFFKEIKDDSAM